MKRILLLGILVSICSIMNAADRISVADGSWSEAATWGGVDNIPTADDRVAIFNSVTLDVDVVVQDLYVFSGGSFDLSNHSMTITEETFNVDFGGTVSTTSGTLIFDNTTSSVAEDMTLNGVSELGTLIMNNTQLINIGFGQTRNVKLSLSSSLDITDSLVCTAGTLVDNSHINLLATSSKQARLGQVGTNAAISGTIEYQIYRENGNDNMQWRYFSFPINGFTVDQYQDLGNYVTGSAVSNPSTSLTQADPAYESFRIYNEATPEWGSHTSNSLTPGVGYAVYDYNVNTDAVFTYTGAPLTGDQSLPVTYTDNGDSDVDGWNLVGNPYMSPIDWENLTVSNTDDGVYYNDNATGSLVIKSYVGGVGNPAGVTSNIAGGQAFWVHATGASPSVTVHESSKANVSQTTLYKKSPIKNIIRLKLLSSNGVADEAVLRFKDDASDDFDGSYDAYKRWQGQVMLSTHYSESAANENRMTLAINALRFNEYDTIPLVLENLEVGDYNLSILENTVLDEVTLIDLETKTEIKLSEITNYVISVEAGEDVITDKYALVTKTRTDKNYEEETAKDVTSLTGVESKETNMRLAVYPNPATGEQLTLSYAELNAGTAIIRLVDMMGVAVHTEQVQVATSGEYILPITNYNNGVYSLIVSQNDEQIAKKIIINKK